MGRRSQFSSEFGSSPTNARSLTATLTLAGKMTTNRTTRPQAATNRVVGTITPTPSRTSAIPEMYTTASGQGTKSGIIRW